MLGTFKEVVPPFLPTSDLEVIGLTLFDALPSLEQAHSQTTAPVATDVILNPPKGFLELDHWLKHRETGLLDCGDNVRPG